MVFPALIGKNGTSITNLETLARLEALQRQQRDRQRLIGMARDYYNGDHPTLLTDRQREFLHLRDRLKFCMNYCRLVVDAPAERLAVTGFQSPDQKVSAWLWQLWNAARLDAISKGVHLAAIRDGEAYLLVDYDPVADRPRLTLNLADEGEGGITMHYSDEGQPLFAVKRWRVNAGSEAGSTRRMTIYYPDRVERYISTALAPHWLPLPTVD